MKFGGSEEELSNRREIRDNVTQALVSLPVSSLQDVDQLSSALTQSTVRNQSAAFIIHILIFLNDTYLSLLYQLRNI